MKKGAYKNIFLYDIVMKVYRDKLLKKDEVFNIILIFVNMIVYYISINILKINYFVSSVFIFIICLIIYGIKQFDSKEKIKNIIYYIFDHIYILFIQLLALILLNNVCNINLILLELIVLVITYSFLFIVSKHVNNTKFSYIERFLNYFLPIVVIFFIILLAYWPGILVSDSMVQWNQTQTGVYTNWHPIVATLCIKLISLIWDTPGFVLFVQSLIIAFLFAHVLMKIEKYYKVDRIFFIIISILFALYPVNFNSAITLLKDSIYSILIFTLSGVVIELINNYDWLNKWKNKIFLIILAFFISAFRHNGIIALSILFIILFIVLKSVRKNIVFVFIAWLILHFGTNMLLVNWFNVEKATYANTYAPVSHLFARMLNTEGVEFTEDEIKEMNRFVDVEKLKNTYQQFNMDPSINCQITESLKVNGKEYIKLCIKKIIEYPTVFVKQYVKLSSFLYAPLPIDDTAYTVGLFEETDLWEYKDVYPQFEENSKLPGLLSYLKNITHCIQQSKFDFIVKRPAMWMYISIIAILLISKKYKNKKIFLIIVPVLCNTISLIPALPVHMTRYIYATILVGWLIISWGTYELYDTIKNKVLIVTKRKDVKE